MSHFTCPRCNRLIELLPEDAGQVVECAQCGLRIAPAPAPEASSAPPQTIYSDPPPPASQPVWFFIPALNMLAILTGLAIESRIRAELAAEQAREQFDKSKAEMDRAMEKLKRVGD